MQEKLLLGQDGQSKPILVGHWDSPKRLVPHTVQSMVCTAGQYTCVMAMQFQTGKFLKMNTLEIEFETTFN